MTLRLLTLMVFSCWLVLVQPALAQETERVPALREKVYGQLARAQEQADKGDVEKGLTILKAVEEKADSMNSYERAMMWNFYGFMHYEQGNTGKAINYFEKVVNEKPIPDSLQKSTLFSLAQLALSDGQFQRSIGFLQQWEALATEDEMSKSWVLKAQAYYQSDEFQTALNFIDKAIAHADAEQETPDENWLILKRALHYEMNQTQQVADVMERLVTAYSKAEYWLQLAGVYAQLEQSEKQLAVLEAARQQGFIEKGSEWRQLAQAYYFNELPFKAAETLQQAMQENKIEASVDNLKFVAQAYTQAKEYQRAVDVYKKASDKVSHGNFSAQIAQLYLNLGNNEMALEYANEAQVKGDLDSAGNLYLAEGIALLNLKRYEQAVASFELAQEHEAVSRSAKQWLKYAKSQYEHQQQVAKLK
ncbi:tetratricopeptide repeat protein [Idiomarina sp. HP20-50]|uniref:tetratricopeptide repeat protein n=1 Tax=Idiomarina sp. HP20-50 TaxID=3070813 RepID=UPI00294B8FDB|nr:CDC27 family protein [Idiomarina sp. HP20-50]MDV6315693.1 CDC27 family protein [Idiomarina sp. HP20-50]